MCGTYPSLEQLPANKISLSTSAIDMHLHVVDFLQRTQGLEALIEAMDQANIAKAVLFGLPVKKKWAEYEPEKPGYYLDNNARCYYYPVTDEILASEYLKLDKQSQQRLAPLLCGFNPTDLFAVEYVEYMYRKYPFWKGIGELLLRHDDLTNLTLDEVARVNHKALEPVFSFCARHQLPVLIHQNSTSVNLYDHFEYLVELEYVLNKHPDTIFVWAHCGISRRVKGKNYTQMVDQLLARHANLYVDISWIGYDEVICDGKEIPTSQWMELIHKHHQRIMIGSDLTGHFEQLGQTMGRYNPLLETLPAAMAFNISRKNAEKIWFEGKLSNQ